jgi:LmbE family N-acetylglucosaminyl deacetylase
MRLSDGPQHSLDADLEYGAASAIARWTRAGKSVGCVVVTNGEARIDGLPPHEAGPIRVA